MLRILTRKIKRTWKRCSRGSSMPRSLPDISTHKYISDSNIGGSLGKMDSRDQRFPRPPHTQIARVLRHCCAPCHICDIFSRLLLVSRLPRDAQRVLPQQQSGLRAFFIAFLFREGREISDPLPGKSASIERACQGASAESTSRCATRGTLFSKRTLVLVVFS